MQIKPSKPTHQTNYEGTLASQHQRNSQKTGKLPFGVNKKSIAAFLIFILLFAAAGYYYKRYQVAISDPHAQAEQKNSNETKEVIKKLGKILSLPSDKQPTVAKVEDPEKLKKTNQTFYKDVQPKDYLILYPDRAIIYRLEENKIINIAPIIDTAKQTEQVPLED